VTGSAADPVAVQYRPSAYSNPIRVVLRGYLGYRSELVEGPADGRGPTFELRTRVVLAIEQLLYRPLGRGALALAAGVRRFQSGRLSSYILYMLAVLIVILALIPALR
ncbi:MAG: hypothetical protein J0H06_16200, partial [Actinobacteria bacterium]|nr:hypothetical protein [Actinomycetota bacterium]